MKMWKHEFHVIATNLGNQIAVALGEPTKNQSVKLVKLDGEQPFFVKRLRYIPHSDCGIYFELLNRSFKQISEATPRWEITRIYVSKKHQEGRTEIDAAFLCGKGINNSTSIPIFPATPPLTGVVRVFDTKSSWAVLAEASDIQPTKQSPGEHDFEFAFYDLQTLKHCWELASARATLLNTQRIIRNLLGISEASVHT